jgi:hypothetical protein
MNLRRSRIWPEPMVVLQERSHEGRRHLSYAVVTVEVSRPKETQHSPLNIAPLKKSRPQTTQSEVKAAVCAALAPLSGASPPGYRTVRKRATSVGMFTSPRPTV